MKIFKKISYNAPVTLSFALLSLLVLLAGYLTNGKLTEMLFYCYRGSPFNPLTYIRLFTHCLGHVNWQHYIGNISYILLLGGVIEEKYGSKNLLKMILVTAFVSGVLNILFFPNIAITGASGVVFMFIVLASVTSVRSGQIPLTMILVVMIYLGQEIYNAIFITDSISQFSHIIGGVMGATIGLKMNWTNKR